MQHRRNFLNNLFSLAATTAIAPDLFLQVPAKTKIKALAFDAFPVFDPRSVSLLAEELFPGKGNELSAAWRTRQFEYQWLRPLSGTYKDFWTTTRDALVFAAHSLKIDLPAEKQDRLLNAYLDLKTWPDTVPALRAMKAAGIKLIFLSNMTEKMLRRNMQVNGLDEYFDEVLSTDSVRNYKPSPVAYQLVIDRLKLKKSEIGFVAFAGWDAAGAKSFGYPTYWINRQHQPMEELDFAPDWEGDSLNELIHYL